MKISQIGSFGENKKCSKPPTRKSISPNSWFTQASTRVEFRTPSAASSVDPSNGNEQKLYQYEGFHKWGYPKMHGL